MTNPNCEYGANFIAIHTLAQWNKCNVDGTLPTVGSDAVSCNYKPFIFTKKKVFQFSQFMYSILYFHEKNLFQLKMNNHQANAKESVYFQNPLMNQSLQESYYEIMVIFLQ